MKNRLIQHLRRALDTLMSAVAVDDMQNGGVHILKGPAVRSTAVLRRAGGSLWGMKTTRRR
jgi:hypothetical protein